MHLKDSYATHICLGDDRSHGQFSVSADDINKIIGLYKIASASPKQLNSISNCKDAIAY